MGRIRLEDEIRVLVYRLGRYTVKTCVVPLAELDRAVASGWHFISIDPEDEASLEFWREVRRTK